MEEKKSHLTNYIEIALDQYGIEATATKLPGEIDDNFLLKTDKGEQYLLKIAHPDTTPETIEFQNHLSLHLQDKTNNFLLPKVIPNKEGVFHFFHNNRVVRLISWIPGRPWATIKPKTKALRQQLGRVCGELTTALTGFDHKAAHRFIKWDAAQLAWIKPYLDLFIPKQKSIVKHFLQLFEELVIPRSGSLRKSVIQNDFNDYNIIVSDDPLNPQIIGIIDFGDAIYTYTICELAIACTYAMMDLPDPLNAIKEIVSEYHKVFPLTEEEMEVLFPLIGARLLISVTASAINKKEHPDNEYLQISERSAWDLLEKLYQLAPNLVNYTIRDACGYTPCSSREDFDHWIKNYPINFASIVPIHFQVNTFTELDLSVDSLELGNFDQFIDDQQFHLNIQQQVSINKVGVGGYGETRPFYTTDNYLVNGNNGPKWRTVHLGLDIWMRAGTPIFCPYPGTVESIHDNKGDRDYGPTIILKHQTNTGLTFYTLYGHLSLESLSLLKVGQIVHRWQRIGTIGQAPENGNWPPHLHFQVMLDLLDKENDFPGVAFPEEKSVWLSICPDPNTLLKIPFRKNVPKLSMDDILTKRRKVIGPNLSISYADHLHIIRGSKQYLFDQEGQRYLDMVNNVAHVGHEHPKVVAAGQQQMAVLNTNSRYLHENLVLYAEELLATLPSELEVCYFVNSGSEANELALRMAHTIASSRNMIAVDIGYHGNTTGAIDVSSYKFDRKGGKGAPKHTHTIPLPDIFRGIHQDPESAGLQYAQYIQRKIEELNNDGQKIAGFICESILSCGGQIVLPPQFLKKAFSYVRSAGGICIMDEVQVGFGRVGSQFWGFELQGVIPDIVTMGKPIGNGHPLGAVVTTRAVADTFTNGMEFFSTFGGNPVSCAIGRAVLSVIQEENLQENSLRVGNDLMNEVNKLQKEYPLIADVRGSGLFIGIELIDDVNQMTPATSKAKYLVNRMRHRGILLSTDGPDENVIKIKPPLCFDDKNVDFFLTNLESVLKEDYLNR